MDFWGRPGRKFGPPEPVGIRGVHHTVRPQRDHVPRHPTRLRHGNHDNWHRDVIGCLEDPRQGVQVLVEKFCPLDGCGVCFLFRGF